jgi:hypothetical protein
MEKKPAYKQLDDELKKEIVGYVISVFREEEEKIIELRHDRKRANIKLLLRKYREIVKHVDKAVFEATQVDDDLTLQDILKLMSGNRSEPFRIETMRENAAKARLLVDHMNRMLDSYRERCERSHKEEEKRRYRVLYDMYISEERKTADEIAEKEFIDRSTVYRDIDAAADILAVLFFGIYGLKFV